MRKQIVILALLIFTLFGCSQADHINNLIQKLADKNSTVSQAAADELVTIGAPAIKPLVALLNSKDSEIRNIVSDILARIGQPAITPLILALSDSSTSQAASQAFVKIGSPAIDALISIMWDKDGGVRYRVVEILGRIQDKRVIQPLIWHLKDDSATVREAAAKGLKSIGSDATEPLMDALREPDVNYRCQIIGILGDIKDIRSIPVLIDSMSDEDITVYQGAAVALEKIGSPAVEPLLNALITSPTNIQYRIYRTLGEIKDDRIVEPLITALNSHDKTIIETAKTALIKIGSPAVDDLINKMQCIYYSNQHSCFSSSIAVSHIIEILGEIKDPRSIETLLDALDRGYGNGYSDSIVLTALENIGEPAIEPLIAVALANHGFSDFDGPSPRYWDTIAAILKKSSTSKSTTMEYILGKALQEKYLNLICRIYPLYITFAEPNCEPVLIELLNDWRYGNKEMAEDFLNSGNIKLEVAAREWVSKRSSSYYISYDMPWSNHPLRYHPKWGASE